MNYLNLKLIHDKGYTLPEVNCLQIVRQNRSEEMEDYLAIYLTDNTIERLFSEDLVKLNKRKNKAETEFSLYRLTKKGEELLELFSTPEITVGDEEMFNYLCDMYLKHEDEDRHIGNKKKTRIYVAQFRKLNSLTLHEMYWVCFKFLQDYPYTKKLENIFFDSNKNRYGKFINNVEDSPLYQYYDENWGRGLREYVEKRIKK